MKRLPKTSLMYRLTCRLNGDDSQLSLCIIHTTKFVKCTNVCYVNWYDTTSLANVK